MKKMPALRVLAIATLLTSRAALIGATSVETEKYGPAAAIAFAAHYRGDVFKPDERTCYPNARGVPFADCENIIPMHDVLWTPAQLIADFAHRMESLPPAQRKRGIIVLLKTERCAPTPARLCSNLTAALEKRSSPLAGEFLIYGLLLKPRDGDSPAGSLPIETGADAWKNEAAGTYHFRQGPGATLAFLDPKDGFILDRSDAARLQFSEAAFTGDSGKALHLHAKLTEVLGYLATRP